MSVRLIPLGTNGFIPSQGRQTMSFLLLHPDSAILLDAGTGVSRLLEQPISEVLRPYGSLNVILSHYHLDHVVGLSYLPAVWRGKPVTIYAPGPGLVHAAAEKALNDLIRPPFFPLTFRDFPLPVTVAPITSDHFQVGSVAVRMRPQKHSGGSAGIRIGDIAYATDTVVDEDTVEFVRGARLLLHEVWLEDAAESRSVGHSDPYGVADIATRAGVGGLMIVHHPPFRSQAEISAIAAAIQVTTPVTIIVPEEGVVYEV
jgi:ribonuclease BN (tRNA processing enzyme)